MKINLLTEYEFNDIATLNVVVETIQREKCFIKLLKKYKESIYELGTEGRLLKMQLDELTDGIEQEEKLVIKDYLQFEKNEKNKTKSNEKSKIQGANDVQDDNKEYEDIALKRN